MMSFQRLFAVALLALGWSASGVRGGTSVNLADTAAGNQRWKDAAHTVYAESYQTGYSYAQARVVVAYETVADTFVGRLVAANLKPNFAYQIKLEAAPGSPCAERLGSVGRYWRETWSSMAWAEGWNLNNKGDGSSPNPNDVTYLANRDVPDATSPTGLKYRFTTYLLLGYFITDANGNGTVDLRLDSSYHVLWREDQRTREAVDGPVERRTFQADAASPAYDSDGEEQTVGIFAEWERLPSGGLRLPDGDYELKLVLTEESFHCGDALDGWWATVMSGPLVFSVGLPPVFAAHPQSVLARSGDVVQFAAEVAGEGGRETTVTWRKDGAEIPGANALQLDLGEVGPEDGGSYACVAANAFGETVSHAAALYVRDDLRTEAEYTLAVGERNARIADLEAHVADMFTDEEVEATVAEARPDRDGDGFTDTQEVERGTDPDRYFLALAPGWNLVSLGRVPEDNTVAGIFGQVAEGSVLTVWSWNPLTLRYEAADRLESSRGHWLYWEGTAVEVDIVLPEHGL
ncbi:MAG: immunoglobulin domain-containing protein [Lentisphaeria bacterium]|jgi:hypothetical protein|nr:immunoglobulin domain-containing protein [Lentisphaeria bacterium]